jgi:hypothetical protein
VTLVVEAPAAYEPERRYVLDVVLGDWLGLDWRLEVTERSDVRITADGDEFVVLPEVLFATAPDAWLTRACLPDRPLARVAGVPVIYGAPADGRELGVDVLGSCFFMLTRLEERVVDTRDDHGRFPALASVAHGEGFLDVPIVDVYVDLLWDALSRRWPRLERRRRAYRVALTHDVDDPLAVLGRSRPDLARQLGADLLVRRDPALAARRVGSWLAGSRGGRRLDPYNTFEFLMDVSERHGLASAFYFMAADGRAGAEDPPYRLDDPWIEALIARIHARGHEVGFHATDTDRERTVGGFERVRAAARRAGVEQETWGGRQHYLRWENPSTWRTWDAAGLDYDATLAYADRIGFRTGTCHEFAVFDLDERRPMRLRERPFQVMDRTLLEYMGLAPDTAHAAVREIADHCRRHDGVLCILWHNNAALGARQMGDYERLVAMAAER